MLLLLFLLPLCTRWFRFSGTTVICLEYALDIKKGNQNAAQTTNIFRSSKKKKRKKAETLVNMKIYSQTSKEEETFRFCCSLFSVDDDLNALIEWQYPSSIRMQHTPTHTPISIQSELVPVPKPILCVCVFAFTLTARMCFPLCTSHIFFPDVFFGCLFLSAFVEFQKRELLPCWREEKYGPPSNGEKWSLLSFFSAIIGGTNFNSFISSNHKSPGIYDMISYVFLHCFFQPSIHRLTLLLHFWLFNSFQSNNKQIPNDLPSFRLFCFRFFCLIGNLFVSN